MESRHCLQHFPESSHARPSLKNEPLGVAIASFLFLAIVLSYFYVSGMEKDKQSQVIATENPVPLDDVIEKGRQRQEDPGNVAARVKKIVAEHLPVAAAKVTPEASFTDLADELGMVELMFAFEEEFACTIPDDAPKSIKTVGDAINYLKGNPDCDKTALPPPDNGGK
jgi:acyl carrier protein